MVYLILGAALIVYAVWFLWASGRVIDSTEKQIEGRE